MKQFVTYPVVNRRQQLNGGVACNVFEPEAVFAVFDLRVSQILAVGVKRLKTKFEVCPEAA